MRRAALTLTLSHQMGHFLTPAWGTSPLAAPDRQEDFCTARFARPGGGSLADHAAYSTGGSPALDLPHRAARRHDPPLRRGCGLAQDAGNDADAQHGLGCWRGRWWRWRRGWRWRRREAGEGEGKSEAGSAAVESGRRGRRRGGGGGGERRWRRAEVVVVVVVARPRHGGRHREIHTAV